MKTHTLTQYDSDSEDYEEVLPDDEPKAFNTVMQKIRKLAQKKPSSKPSGKSSEKSAAVIRLVDEQGFRRTGFKSGLKRIGFIGITFNDLYKSIGKPTHQKSGSSGKFAWDFKLRDKDYNQDKFFSIQDAGLKDSVSPEDNTVWTLMASSNANMSDLMSYFPQAKFSKSQWELSSVSSRRSQKETAAPPSGISGANRTAIKQAQENIRKTRKKRDVDLKNATDKIRKLQDKVHDLKFQNVPARDKQKTEASNMKSKPNVRANKSPATVASKYNALARLQFLVQAKDSDEFQPRVMPNDKEESKAFKIPLWYFHYVKKVAGISLDRPNAFDILRFKPNIAVKILMQVPQFKALARNQHKEEAVNWNRKADKYEAAYNALVAKAGKDLKAKGVEMGPLISGIVSDEFPNEVKDRLRFLIRAKQKYRDVARIHEAAVKSRLTL